MRTSASVRHYWKSVVLGLALGCGDGITEPSDIAGVYALQSVSGQSLPYTEPAGSAIRHIDRGEVGIRADGTWYWIIESRFIYSTGTIQNASDGRDGTFTMSGGDLVLTDIAFDFVQGTYPAHVDGKALTLTIDGRDYLFRR